MKKLALLAALGLGAVASYGQGFFNSFNAFPPGAFSYVRGLDGQPLAKAPGRVEITTLAGEILSPVKDGQGNPLVADGIFAMGIMEIPGSTVGQSASVILRAWDNSTGATYAAALEKAQITVTWASIGGNTAPSNFVLDSNFTGLTLQVVPEPSTVALAALGVAGLFFVARRKH